MRRLLTALLVAAVAVLGLTSPSYAGDRHGHHADHHGGHHGWCRGLGYTQVVIAPDVYQLVASAGITPAPLDGAKAFPYEDTLAARFPITGFSLSGLTLTHSGGISLTAGSASIALRDFYISLASGTVSADVTTAAGGDLGRVDVFTLGFSDRYDLGLVKLSLTDAAAAALDSTFGVTAFAGGATFGYATPRPFAPFRSTGLTHATQRWIEHRGR